MRLVSISCVAALLLASVSSAAVYLSPPHYIPSAPEPSFLQAADLNGDGIPDLIEVAYGGLGLWIHFGDGSSFGPGVEYGWGDVISDVRTGDVDRDGHVDLLVTTGSHACPCANPGLHILRNDGQGGFANQTYVPVFDATSAFVWDVPARGAPHIVVMGENGVNPFTSEFYDLSPDGKGSYIVSAAGGWPSTSVDPYPRPAQGSFVPGADHGILVLCAAGDAVVTSGPWSIEWVNTTGTSLVAPSPIDVATPRPQKVITADFDGDGNQDVLIWNYDAPGSAELLRGTAEGSFVAAPPVALGTGGADVAVADMDQDGKLDLVVVGWSSGILRILPGNGDGTFGAPIDFPARLSSAAGISVAVADFNGDGFPDVAIETDGGTSTTKVIGWRFNQRSLLDAGSPPRLHAMALSASPNPAIQSTQIELDGPVPGPYRVRVIDVTGREVATLLDETTSGGRMRLRWDLEGGPTVAPGIYHLVAEGPTGRSTIRIAVVH